MLIIGERINTSRKSIGQAVAAADAAFIQEEAKAQAAAGAGLIDVNCGTFVDEEPARLAWLVRIVQEATDIPLCLDSPNPRTLAKALSVHRGRAMINSITAEKARWEAVLPLVKEHGTRIIALTMDDNGIPESAAARFDIAARLVDDLTRQGIAPDDIFIDPLVRPVSTGTHYALDVYETVRRVHRELPEVHLVCGLSNISFGLPQRKLVNRAFLVQAMASGLDAAILDPLDAKLMSLMRAAELLLNRDEYAQDYLLAFRESRLEV